LALLVFSGCNLVDLTPKAPDFEEDGTLIILINDDNLNSRFLTIAPGNLVVESYTITSVGPDNETIIGTALGSATSFIQYGLSPGEWTVTIEAFDTTPSLIASGVSETFTVVPNVLEDVTVFVVPLTTGTGILNLTLEWPDNSIPEASFDYSATLTDDSDVVTDIIFTEINYLNGTATYALDSLTLAPGYYDLFIQITDGGTAAATDVGIVRILQGTTTTGTAAFSSLDDGGATLDITTNLQDTFPVTFGALSATISKTQAPLTMDASVTDDASGDTFRWFLNGLEDTSQTINPYTINSALLAVGFYRLTVFVYRDGGISTNTVTFSVIE
jgi:hypothetical protein